MTQGSPAKMKFSDTQASVLLDLVRGLAAILVLAEHWHNLLFDDFNTVHTHRALWLPLYLFSAAGHEAVVVFFVLSGYLISRSIFNMFARNAWSWKTYLIHRFVRLWVVLLPGLLLCALWDQVGLSLHLAPALYGGAYYNHMIGDVAKAHTVPVFFANLFFLQGIRAPVFGSDGALWSVANEFWYYLLFPCALIALRRSTSLANRLLTILVFLGIACLIGPMVLFAWLTWLLGSLLAALPPMHTTSRVRTLAAGLYVVLLFALAKQTLISNILCDSLLAIATFFLLRTLLSALTPAVPSPRVRISRDLARFSYTLYVVHTPFLLLLVAIFIGDTRWNPSPAHLFAALGILLLTLLYAYGVASITEFHSDRIRRWCERLLATNHASSTAPPASM
jgi:peptidoglycan/LPS O-acetylase OafA/YrhL